MRDPIELYEYPEEWIRRAEEKEGRKVVRQKVESGLYILSSDGWLKRGITTGTASSLAIVGAVESLYGEVNEAEVWTPAGIYLKLKVEAKNGFCKVRKFSGDHSFDKTDGLEFVAEVKGSEITFGKGIGVKDGKKAVSKAAMIQIRKNFEIVSEKTGYEGGVEVSAPRGELLGKVTGNERVGVKGGISILGTTGFVEPWCEKLVRTKVEIMQQYERVAITTGREGFRFALKHFPDFQPFVFGIHIEEALRGFNGEVIIVGKPALLSKWAVPELKGKILGGAVDSKIREKIFQKAKEINENVVDVVLI